MRPLLRKHFRLLVPSLALLALGLVAATSTQAQTTFTVTSTNDSGPGWGRFRIGIPLVTEQDCTAGEKNVLFRLL